MLNEELLSAWLELTSVIDNQRLGSDRQGALPFNEAVVCSLLAGAQREGRSLTASELCARTRILKSQMNAILGSLERKGIISRQRSHSDRRQVELRLMPEGFARYESTHRRVLGMVDRLIARMGEEKVRSLLPLLRQAAEIFDQIQQEG